MYVLCVCIVCVSENSSGSVSVDVRELWVVRESLALSLQMGRRTEESLQQYQQLGTLLRTNAAAFPPNHWPLPCAGDLDSSSPTTVAIDALRLLRTRADCFAYR
jgi:hypothetical protein